MGGLALSFLVAAISFVQDEESAQRFLRSMDRDSDGFVSRAEWSGAGATFLRADKNHDAYLTAEELVSTMGKPSRRRRAEDDDDAEASDFDALMVSIRSLRGTPPRQFSETCTACHDTERILTARKDAGGWRTTVDQMQAKDEATFSDRDASQIVEYLEQERARAAAEAQSMGSENPLEEWAQVLSGARFHRFDKNRDGRLVGPELTALLFERLDFDGDKSLNAGEFALMPVGIDRRAAFAAADRNHNGKLSAKEMGSPDALLQVADSDGDGALSPTEVPRVRRGPARAFLALDADTVLKRLDRNRDGFLTLRELIGREEFARRYDRDNDTKLSASELDMAITAARAAGVGGWFDDLVTRFDLDGDGEVDAEEFPGPKLVFRRCDSNGDGVLSGKDGDVRPPSFDANAQRWRQGRG